ncbi:MAG TPA: hypothetical protein VIE37_08215 [Methylomirabilota bacterium]|jgi:hypothetical protein
MGGHEERKDTPVDRESTYRALMRDVILGTLAVVFVSLAVPAWIIRVEYRKSFATPAALAPAAEILRERAAPAPVAPRPPHILELAERLVRQEAERRAAERRAAERRAAERRAAERPAATMRATEDAPTRGLLPPPARPDSSVISPSPIEIPQSP